MNNYIEKWEYIGRYSGIVEAPKMPGCYVFYLVKSIKPRIVIVLYIGHSSNLQNRLSRHKLYYELRDKYFYISTKVKICKNHKDLEKKLIQRLRPKYNKMYNWRICAN